MKFRNRYWQVQNRCAAEQVALLQRIEAGGVEVDIDEVSAVEPDPVIVEQADLASLFDLDPMGTGVMVPIGISCRAARFCIANYELKVPFPHEPFEWLEPQNLKDKYREYVFPGKRPRTCSLREVINHRKSPLQHGDHIEGVLLGTTSTPIPAHWRVGGINATLSVLDHLRNRCRTEIKLLVEAPRTRSRPLVAKTWTSHLFEPIEGGLGRGVATADSFGDRAPERR